VDAEEEEVREVALATEDRHGLDMMASPEVSGLKVLGDVWEGQRTE